MKKFILILFDLAYRLEIYIFPVLWLLCTYYYEAEYLVLLAYFVFALPYLIFVGIFGENKVYHLLHKYNDWLYANEKEYENKKEYLEFSFVDNSILLKTETINKNGFYEVWRQEKENHFIQILCFNPNTGEFQAFDRFHWSDEPRVVKNPPSWFVDEKGNSYHHDSFESDGVYYKEDLWTPIKFHYTVEWLNEHLQ